MLKPARSLGLHGQFETIVMAKQTANNYTVAIFGRCSQAKATCSKEQSAAITPLEATNTRGGQHGPA